jgi:hypothetical protein
VRHAIHSSTSAVGANFGSPGNHAGPSFQFAPRRNSELRSHLLGRGLLHGARRTRNAARVGAMTTLEPDDDEKAALVELLGDDRHRSLPTVVAYPKATGDPRQAGAAGTTARALPGAEAGRRAEHGAGEEKEAAIGRY